jgi:UDP-N-acetylglucosamine 2-epimerase (non-hydrolysing)
LTEYRPAMMKVMLVAGTRPDPMKIAPIIERMKRFSDYLDPLLVHTGQHYDSNLSQVIFDDMGLQTPDIQLSGGSGTHAGQTAMIMTEFEKTLMQNSPHLVVVPGDSNSSLACALTAAKCGILIAHLGSGLRSFHMNDPEEVNRVAIDRISDYHFAGESAACQNLSNEGIDENIVFFVGNIIIDSLLNNLKQAQSSAILKKLGLKIKDYALLTLHRPENVDNAKTLENILTAIMAIAEKKPVIFPCHPRTRLNIDKFGLSSYFDRTGIRRSEPVGYLDFLKLESEALMVLTDSGGVQEETTILNIPCLTLRSKTERLVTVTEGTNTPVGPYPEKIVAEAENIMRGNVKSASIPKYWDGRAAKRIVDILMNVRQSLFEPESIKDGTKKIKTVREAIVSEG